ncbi:MAG TPA: DMT family transporter [Candidatus Thermoplasmatota archaeon]
MDRAALKPFIALIFVQFFFASLAVVGKVALETFPPLMVAAMRLFFASLFLGAIAIAVQREHLPPMDAAKLFGLALLGIVFNQLLFLGGLSRTTAVNASILIATIPVFTTFFAILLGQEAPKLVRIGGIAVSLLGALAILGIQGFDLGSDFALGNLFVILNSLSYSMYLVLSRGLLRKYRSTTIVAWTFIFGAFVVTPLGALRATTFDFGNVPMVAWWAMAWIIIVPSVLSYSLNTYALKRIHSSTVATYIFLQPLFGIALAFVILDERLSLQTAFGGLLVLAGVVLVSRSEAVEPMATIPDEPQPRQQPRASNKEAMTPEPIEGADGRPKPKSQEDH